MVDLVGVTADAFSRFVGEALSVAVDETGEEIVELALDEVQPSRFGVPGGRVPFSLFLSGPSEVPLSQDTYWVSVSELGKIPIFLVPVADDGTSRQYQAVFA